MKKFFKVLCSHIKINFTEKYFDTLCDIKWKKLYNNNDNICVEIRVTNRRTAQPSRLESEKITVLSTCCTNNLFRYFVGNKSHVLVKLKFWLVELNGKNLEKY